MFAETIAWKKKPIREWVLKWHYIFLFAYIWADNKWILFLFFVKSIFYKHMQGKWSIFEEELQINEKKWESVHIFMIISYYM